MEKASTLQNRIHSRTSLRLILCFVAIGLCLSAVGDFYGIWQSYIWGSVHDSLWIKISLEAVVKFVVAGLCLFLTSIGLHKDVILQKALDSSPYRRWRQ